MIGGDDRGRRRNLESLNKSAVVLTCAIWEAFVEDLAAETLLHLAELATTPDMLPSDLQKNLMKFCAQSNKNELALWGLAGDGWRDLLRRLADKLSQEDGQTLSSPSSQKVDAFIRQQTGISGLSDSWKWSGVTADRAQERLDDLVKLRNAIAHRGGPLASSVTKKQASDGLSLVKRIAACSLAHVDESVGKLVGKKLIPAPIPIELPDPG